MRKYSEDELIERATSLADREEYSWGLFQTETEYVVGHWKKPFSGKIYNFETFVDLNEAQAALDRLDRAYRRLRFLPLNAFRRHRP
jgi:hypothetical protein